MTVVPPKFTTVELDSSVVEKIALSLLEFDGEEVREIPCPYCTTPLATVTKDMKEGFLISKCQKCKSVTPLNLAYFYTSRSYSRPPAFLQDIENTI